jgi:hypothetical protein
MDHKRLYADLYMLVVAIAITVFTTYNCSKDIDDEYTLDDFVLDMCVIDMVCFDLDLDKCITKFGNTIGLYVHTNNVTYDEDAARKCVEEIHNRPCGVILELPKVCLVV